MALSINSISINLVKKEKRLNPKYFRFFKKRENLINNSKLNFSLLSDKLVTNKITDGEHQAINLYHEDKKEAEVRYLYVHNVKEGIVDLTDSMFISKKDHERLSRSALENGNVLLTIVGNIGKSAMVYDYIGICNIPRNIAKIISNEKNILPEFLTAFFLSRFGREQSFYSSGGNLQGLLSLTKVKKMFVPVPDKKAQQDIASIYQEILENETKSLSLLAEAKKTFYDNIKLRFDTIEKLNFFQTDLKNLKKSDMWTPKFYYPLYVNTEEIISKKFEIVPLGEACIIEKGIEVGSENYKDQFEAKNSDIPFIRTSDFVNFEIDIFPDLYIPQEIYSEVKQNLNKGDILFTKDGKIGICGMLTKEDNVVISSGITSMRLKEKYAQKYNLTPEYIFLILSLKETGLYPALRRTVIATTIPHLRKERMEQIKIPLIESGTIKKITELVKKAFELKEEKKKLMKEMKFKMDTLLEN